VIRRAILSALSSACHGAGDALAYLLEEPDAQPAEEERAEAIAALQKALDEKNAWQVKHEELKAERNVLLERVAELQENLDGTRVDREELRRCVAELETRLSRASYWKRGEPEGPTGMDAHRVLFWEFASGRAVEHTLFGGDAVPNWAQSGWYAEALGAPPSEEVKP